MATEYSRAYKPKPIIYQDLPLRGVIGCVEPAIVRCNEKPILSQGDHE